jgi:hypothetical protein
MGVLMFLATGSEDGMWRRWLGIENRCVVPVSVKRDDRSLRAELLRKIEHVAHRRGAKRIDRLCIGRRPKGEYPEKKRVFASRVREDTWAKLQRAAAVGIPLRRVTILGLLLSLPTLILH